MRPPPRGRRRGPAEPIPGSIYGLLRHDIVMLRLRPGERLSENELAARFGTSRAPVREALIRLVEDGLIEVRPQRGSFVSRISLRGHGAGAVRARGAGSRGRRRAAEQGISAASRSELEAAITGQIAAGGDAERFTRQDDLFHRGLAEAAGLGNVWDVIEREKAQFDRIRYLSLPSSTPVDVLVEQHRAILDAVAERRPAAAERAIRRHMREVLRIAPDLAARHEDLILSDL